MLLELDGRTVPALSAGQRKRLRLRLATGAEAQVLSVEAATARVARGNRLLMRVLGGIVAVLINGLLIGLIVSGDGGVVLVAPPG